MIQVPKGQAPPRPGQQGQPQIDIRSTLPIICEECKGDLFIPAFYMRKASALMNPQGQDAIVPIQTFCCGNCGHINKEFIPVFMQAESEIKEKEENVTHDAQSPLIIKP